MLSPLLSIIRETLCSNASNSSFLVSVASSALERITESVWKENTDEHSHYEAITHIHMCWIIVKNLTIIQLHTDKSTHGTIELKLL